MKLKPGIDQYPLPPFHAIRRVEVDFRTKEKPAEPCYPLVLSNLATIKAARKQDDRKRADPVYYIVDGDQLHVEPMPVRAGTLSVTYLPPEEVA